MPYRLKNILLLCSFFCILLLFGCEDKQTTQGQYRGNLKGLPAPDFTVYNNKGEQVSLSDYRGKVVILNFWATWCPPCREEMPSMEQLHRRFADKGLVMLAVNVEEEGTPAVKEFLNQSSFTFSILFDPEGDVQNSYQIFRYPETYIIDRNGVVVEKVTGAIDWMGSKPLQLINFLVNG